MKIIRQYNWNRRDFCYDMKCEHCDHIVKNRSGYDDDNYYNNVMPQIKCPKCNESSDSKQSEELQTKVIPRYDPNFIM